MKDPMEDLFEAEYSEGRSVILLNEEEERFDEVFQKVVKEVLSGLPIERVKVFRFDFDCSPPLLIMEVSGLGGIVTKTMDLEVRGLPLILALRVCIEDLVGRFVLDCYRGCRGKAWDH